MSGAQSAFVSIAPGPGRFASRPIVCALVEELVVEFARTCLPPLSLVSTAFRAEALPGPLELGCTSDDHLAADIPHPCQQAFLWAAHRLSVPAASNATRKSFVLRHASPTWRAKCSASARKSRTCAATTTAKPRVFAAAS